jgi:hypothetical protein
MLKNEGKNPIPDRHLSISCIPKLRAHSPRWDEDRIAIKLARPNRPQGERV